MPRRVRSSSAEDGEEQAELTHVKSKKVKKEEGAGPASASTSTRAKEGTGATIEKNDDGDQYLKLSEYRRLTVRTFKGKVLVDIRDMYKDKNSGQMKPGAKGISLTKEQWDLIKTNTDSVDDMIASISEK